MTQPPDQPPQGGSEHRRAAAAAATAARRRAASAPRRIRDSPRSPAPAGAAAPQARPRRSPATATRSSAGPCAPAAAGPLRHPAPAAGPVRPSPGRTAPRRQPGPYQAPAQPGPYGTPPGPGYGYPQQAPQFPGAPTPPPAGGGGRNPFRGKPALIVGGAVALLLSSAARCGPCPAAVARTTRSPSPARAARPPPPRARPPSTTGTATEATARTPRTSTRAARPARRRCSGTRRRPSAPGSGADAPGMWITAKTAVKAAYKEVVAYNVADGRPTWAADHVPAEDLRGHPREDGGRQGRRRLHERHQRPRQVQPAPADRPEHRREGLDGRGRGRRLFDSAISVELSLAGNTLMVGRSQSGTAYDVRHRQEAVRQAEVRRRVLPDRVRGRTRADRGGLLRRLHPTEHDEIQELDPATGKVRWTQKFAKGWTVARDVLRRPVGRLQHRRGQEDLEHLDVQGRTARSARRSASTRPSPPSAAAASCSATSGLPGRGLRREHPVPADRGEERRQRDRRDRPVHRQGEVARQVPGRRVDAADEDRGRHTLVAYVEPSYDARAGRWCASTAAVRHTPTKLLQNPQGTADIENGFFSRDIDWVGGRFYISTTRLKGNDETKEKLMLAYGK